MRRLAWSWLLFAGLGLGAAAASAAGAPVVQLAQNQPDAGVNQPAPPAQPPAQPPVEPAGQPLRIVVNAVKGMVQVRQAEGQPWQRAQVGMELNIGARVRTGLNSAVQIVIEPGQIVTLDRLGEVAVLDAVRDGAAVKTDIGMRYGRTRYDVEEVGELHDARLHTPGATLAVRGTWIGAQFDALDNRTWSVQGLTQVTNEFRRQSLTIARGVSTDRRLTPASNLSADTKVDGKTAFAARTEQDDLLVEAHPDGRFDKKGDGIDEFQRLAKMQDIRTALIGVVGNVLTVDILWFGGDGPTDVDGNWLDSFGGTLESKGAQIVRAGQPNQGRLNTGDDMGAGGFGLERATYGPVIPDHVRVTVQLVDGSFADGRVIGRLDGETIVDEFFTLDDDEVPTRIVDVFVNGQGGQTAQRSRGRAAKGD